ETNRFANIRLEDMQGDMFGLCKDQHGCRFLQRKLEEGDPAHRDMIFAEIYPHFGELMTDAFGNYLSQKLLEYSSDEQRDLLIESISGELVSISLNMHGTRAVQKMIDFLSTQRQVQSLIVALNLNVVTLIKDLNGNHVIQKCLNHLPPDDNQFIYNAVSTNCIEVATHRHGCCVLQRCIDHASESQRIQLVTEITYNSLTLVQDPFGNYVVQYVLDLNDSRFIEAIVRQFLGNVCALSMQKFSSNVVEKCIRVSDPAGRQALVEELSGRQRLERLLRDSFANYVVQTALDYSDPAQRAHLVDNIKPILPMIRNTPYGKRIQSKIQREGMDSLRSGGTGFHPTLVSGGYFLTPSHISAPTPPHHIQPIIDSRSSFLGNNPGNPAPSARSVTSKFPVHQLTSPTTLQPNGFSTPWSTSTLTSLVPHAYASIGMGLGRENQAAT
ncbi:armadillo-type protein, partial [Phakopsora pachyrhizi]